MATKKIKEETQPVPRKVRGVLTALGGDSFEFKPYKEGEPTQQNVVTVGKSKMYDTTGKTPQRVAHLIVPSDVTDVRAELFRQVDELTQKDKTENTTPVVKPEETVVLHKGEGMRLMIDEKERKFIFVQEIPLKRGTNYVGEMIAAVNRCSQTIAVNRSKVSTLEQ